MIKSRHLISIESADRYIPGAYVKQEHHFMNAQCLPKSYFFKHKSKIPWVYGDHLNCIHYCVKYSKPTVSLGGQRENLETRGKTVKLVSSING